MASEVQLDALPYVDQGYDEPGVREAVSFVYFFATSYFFLCRTLHFALIV